MANFQEGGAILEHRNAQIINNIIYIYIMMCLSYIYNYMYWVGLLLIIDHTAEWLLKSHQYLLDPRSCGDEHLPGICHVPVQQGRPKETQEERDLSVTVNTMSLSVKSHGVWIPFLFCIFLCCCDFNPHFSMNWAWVNTLLETVAVRKLSSRTLALLFPCWWALDLQ